MRGLTLFKQEAFYRSSLRRHVESKIKVRSKFAVWGSKWWKVHLPTPESAGRIMGFLLPRAIRERCFEPYFEELKLDRIEKRQHVKGRLANGLVEGMFYLRLLGTYIASLWCAVGGFFAKLSPVLKWLLGPR